MPTTLQISRQENDSGFRRGRRSGQIRRRRRSQSFDDFPGRRAVPNSRNGDGSDVRFGAKNFQKNFGKTFRRKARHLGGLAARQFFGPKIAEFLQK